jgi:hypothetical protein
VTALDLAADLGLLAVAFATANICIGLLIWGRYSPVRRWPHRRFDVFRLHRWTGYATLIFAALHPLPLLASSHPAFRVMDVAFPVRSPQQPVENTIGAAALYLFVIVIATSIYRIEIGRRIWKRLHYLTYAAAACLFAHGIWTDPILNHSPLNPFDAEKSSSKFAWPSSSSRSPGACIAAGRNAFPPASFVWANAPPRSKIPAWRFPSS